MHPVLLSEETRWRRHGSDLRIEQQKKKKCMPSAWRVQSQKHSAYLAWCQNGCKDWLWLTSPSILSISRFSFAHCHEEGSNFIALSGSTCIYEAPRVQSIANTPHGIESAGLQMGPFHWGGINFPELKAECKWILIFVPCSNEQVQTQCNRY